MIRDLKIHRTAIAWLVLFAGAAIISVCLSRTQPNRLPDMTRYKVGSEFKISLCTSFHHIPYMNWYSDLSGEAGSCDVFNYYNPPVREVHLILDGNIIQSASIYFNETVQVEDFLIEWGEPLKLRNWRRGMQIVWDGAIMYVSKGTGGRADHVWVRYVYIYK